VVGRNNEVAGRLPLPVARRLPVGRANAWLSGNHVLKAMRVGQVIVRYPSNRCE
jgi:hypothetical protein